MCLRHNNQTLSNHPATFIITMRNRVTTLPITEKDIYSKNTDDSSYFGTEVGTPRTRAS